MANDPPALQFTFGMSAPLTNATRVVDAINLMAAHPTFASNVTVNQLVPIPPGCEEQARQIVEQLTHLPPAVVDSRPPNEIAAALARRARRGYLLSAALFVVGLVLLVLGNSHGAAYGVTGFLMWCAVPLLLIWAIFQSFAARKQRRKSA